MPDVTPFEIRVLRTFEEVEGLRTVWSAMQRSPESDIDFFSFVVKIRPEILRPHVLVVYRNGEPVSLLAGRVEDSHLEIKLGYRVLGRVNLRRLAIFYDGFMGQTSPEISESVVRQLVRSLREETADVLWWSGVRPRTDLHRLLKRIPNFLCRDYLARPARHWRMNLPASVEEMLEHKMNKKHRYWARRTVRQLENSFPGAIRYARFSAPHEMERLYEDVLRVARKTYQWSLGVGFQDNAEQRQRLQLEAEHGWLRGHVLYVNDEPAAFWLCLAYQGVAYSAFTGYDPRYRKYEIGTALFLWMIGELCRENLKQLDFGLGSALYKERFGDSDWEEAALGVFAFGLRGISLNALRLVTQWPVQLARACLARFALEQKLKTIWRRRTTTVRESPELANTQG